VIFAQLALIAFLFMSLRQAKKRLKEPVPDQTATELLRDLTNGGAIAVLKVIDPSSMFLYSPRER